MVGKGTKFTIYEDADVEPYLEGIKSEPRGPPPPPDAPGVAPMEFQEAAEGDLRPELEPEPDVAVEERQIL